MMARGTEFRDALAAIDRVRSLGHYRPETVHRAVGATLAYVGARRLQVAGTDTIAGASDRRLLGYLAQVEDAAIRLDAIPQRSARADERAEVWREIITTLIPLRALLEAERKVARQAVVSGAA